MDRQDFGLALQIESVYSIGKLISRIVQAQLLKRLAIEPAAALLGPRQAGKTTLARSLATHYFDLEQAGDQTRLDAQWDEIMASPDLVAFDEAKSLSENSEGSCGEEFWRWPRR